MYTATGEPTAVIWISPVEENPDAYEVEFDTGEIFKADGNHLWVTMTDAERLSASRLDPEWRAHRRAHRIRRAKLATVKPWAQKTITRLNQERQYDYKSPPAGAVRATRQIYETLRVGKSGRANHSVAVAGPVERAEADLPIDPYLLGLWLGDGTSSTGVIGMMERDWAHIMPHIPDKTTWVYRTTKNRNEPFISYRFDGLTKRLKHLCVRDHKRIPDCYLYASVDQRIALLQGFMDTDGYCNKRGQCELLLSKKDLLEDAFELVSSLGIKATIRKKVAACRGKQYGYAYRIKFMAPFPAFRLPRKLERQKTSGFRDTVTRRYIVDVRPCAPVPMRCLQVAHPSGTYLLGKSFIPTHNSHALRWDLIEWCLWVPGIECYLFRKTYPDLEANHIRPMRLEMPIELGEWQETRKRFHFRNGSGLNFAYCERDTDVDHYQGREIHVLAVDEAAQMTPFILSYLYARNRLGGFRESVPERYQHLLPRAVFASNPGGSGHNWLKEIFIDPAPAEKIFYSKQFANPQDPSDPGPPTVFIPAKMVDNVYLDASYAGQFSGLPDELARALRDGDWDAVVGKALHLLSRERHMLRPFVPPKHWTHFMTIDWGLAVPFSVGWYTVSEGAELAAAGGHPARWLPEGAVIRYAEWYGWNGKANTGCRLPPQSVARGIIEREESRGDTMDYRVGDTEMWAQKTGPSVQEWFVETDPRLVMKQAIKDRRRNYQEVLARLAGSPRYLHDGRMEEDPMFFITSNCTQFWRTVPSLSLDENDPDKGPNTKLEDHGYDEVAYALRSQPYVTTLEHRQIREYEEIRKLRRVAIDPYATH